MGGVVLDTGALIALERRNERAKALWKLIFVADETVVVPAAVLAEWWRGQSWIRNRMLGAVWVEPVTRGDALLAGEALAKCGTGPSSTDALVVAVAGRLGIPVYTGDGDDLQAVNNAAGWGVVVRRLP